MVYRIRYRTDDAQEEEVTIEAGNSAEAVVKFHHTHPSGCPGRTPSERITSISADQHCHERHWDD